MTAAAPSRPLARAARILLAGVLLGVLAYAGYLALGLWS